MLTTSQVLESIQLGDWFTTINLKDGVLSRPDDSCTQLIHAFLVSGDLVPIQLSPVLLRASAGYCLQVEMALQLNTSLTWV